MAAILSRPRCVNSLRPVMRVFISDVNYVVIDWGNGLCSDGCQAIAQINPD